jgi:hypothetical protein
MTRKIKTTFLCYGAAILIMVGFLYLGLYTNTFKIVLNGILILLVVLSITIIIAKRNGDGVGALIISIFSLVIGNMPIDFSDISIMTIIVGLIAILTVLYLANTIDAFIKRKIKNKGNKL